MSSNRQYSLKQAKKVIWVLNIVEEHINVPFKYF